MHSHSIDRWTHEHLYLGAHHARDERRSKFVIALTAVMMVAEIVAGIAFGSMALFADGIHMVTHAGALFISVAAYPMHEDMRAIHASPSARARLATSRASRAR